MSREIRFRELTEKGKWAYGSLIRDYRLIDTPSESVIRRGNSNTQVVSKTVGQFTNLQDKNGIDIYEGDIVKAFNNINKHTDPGLTAKAPEYSVEKYVEYLEGGFCLSSKKYPQGGCGRLETYRPNKSKFLEVVGNIHDNFNLLT